MLEPGKALRGRHAGRRHQADRAGGREHCLGGEGGLGEEAEDRQKPADGENGPAGGAAQERCHYGISGWSVRGVQRVATRLSTKVLPENWTCPGALMCSSIRRRLRPRRAESERVSYQYSAADAPDRTGRWCS